jgi:hypothetical protein
MDDPQANAPVDRAEPPLDRNTRIPGSWPSFAESPLAQVWARASDTRRDATTRALRRPSSSGCRRRPAAADAPMAV